MGLCEVEELYYIGSENKGNDLRTAQLIHVFVFAFAKSRVSHHAAHTLSVYKLLLVCLNIETLFVHKK